MLNPIDSEGNLHVPATKVNKPCEECKDTSNYPNLELTLDFVGKVVLCKKCLKQVVDSINRALKNTSQE